MPLTRQPVAAHAGRCARTKEKKARAEREPEKEGGTTMNETGKQLTPALYVDISRHMDMNLAIKAFGALSQKTRLEAFRLLVQSGSEGMAAGNIARALDIPHNTMSSHLAILVNAGLVTSQREGRSIIYSIDLEGTRTLLSFLMEDCCQGRPEICAPVLDSVLPGCCT